MASGFKGISRLELTSICGFVLFCFLSCFCQGKKTQSPTSSEASEPKPDLHNGLPEAVYLMAGAPVWQ